MPHSGSSTSRGIGELRSSDVRNMIGPERAPRLRGRFPQVDHVLGHDPFGKLVAQEEQL